MELAPDGAKHIRAALAEPDLATLESALAEIPPNRPGARLAGNPALSALLAPKGPIGRYAVDHLGPEARPVRALLFNKTAAQNWSLAWHQDRTIAVRTRVATPGFANWTVKSGIQHVEPSTALLERMLTLRLHLDDTGPDNAPLLIAPGSHRLGRLPEREVVRTVAQLGTVECIAARGDIWLYATPILHASEPARAPTTRRVLQVDYSTDELPGELDWLGV
jgi:hypothetical protein